MWRRRGMELHQSLPQEACIERTVLLLLLAVAAAAATHFLFGFLTTMFARNFISQPAFFDFDKTWFSRWNEKEAIDVANAIAASETQKSEGRKEERQREERQRDQKATQAGQ